MDSRPTPILNPMPLLSDETSWFEQWCRDFRSEEYNPELKYQDLYAQTHDKLAEFITSDYPMNGWAPYVVEHNLNEHVRYQSRNTLAYLIMWAGLFGNLKFAKFLVEDLKFTFVEDEDPIETMENVVQGPNLETIKYIFELNNEEFSKYTEHLLQFLSLNYYKSEPVRAYLASKTAPDSSYRFLQNILDMCNEKSDKNESMESKLEFVKKISDMCIQYGTEPMNSEESPNS